VPRTDARRHGPLRAGLIGLGAIGGGVAAIARERHADDIEIVGALVRDPARSRGPAPSGPLVRTVAELLAARPEIVAEVAGHEALRQHGMAVLRAGVDLLTVSAGALADPALCDALVEAAREGGARLRVVSGAIGALDAIAAAAVGGLDRVTHTTRKPAGALLSEAEAAALRAPRELFRGPAREGVLRFPESVNVAAAVSLAGIGFDRTELVVVADPAIDRNRHEVTAEGAFGTLRFEIANVPTPENPRTGRIVAMSVVRALLDHRTALVVG
jgi:aspartate dehydrogenase